MQIPELQLWSPLDPALNLGSATWGSTPHTFQVEENKIIMHRSAPS